MFGIWHWLLYFTGTTGSTYWYNWWSGFGSCLTEFAIIAFVWKKVNCHAAGCYRVGLHRVAGTHFITCRKHHPSGGGSGKSTAEEIKQAHVVAASGAITIKTSMAGDLTKQSADIECP